MSGVCSMRCLPASDVWPPATTRETRPWTSTTRRWASMTTRTLTPWTRQHAGLLSCACRDVMQPRAKAAWGSGRAHLPFCRSRAMRWTPTTTSWSDVGEGTTTAWSTRTKTRRRFPSTSCTLLGQTVSRAGLPSNRSARRFSASSGAFSSPTRTGRATAHTAPRPILWERVSGGCMQAWATAC